LRHPSDVCGGQAHRRRDRCELDRSVVASFKQSQSGSTETIGDKKIAFKGNDWSTPAMTGLGKNSAGKLGSWTASASWLCSGSTLYDLRTGKHGKDDLFADLKAQNSELTWFLRLLGFVLLWLAFCCLAGPLEVAADCIPCIGPYLGDAVHCVISVVSCLPATFICIFVVCVVWVAMRPLVGLPLMFLTCVGGGLAAYFQMKAREQRKGGGQQDGLHRPSQPPVQLGAPTGNDQE